MISHFLRKYLQILLLGWGISLSAQYSMPQKPDILYPVYDEVGVLSEQEKKLLNDKLIKFEDSTSTEIEIIIIPSTKGEDINFLATKFGQNWQIGKKGSDNGIVFLIATEDRKLSIQQGRAVEKYLTASVTGQIIDFLVIPHLKEGNWYKAIDEGTNALMEATQGKFKHQKKSNKGGSPVLVVIIFIVIMIVLISYYNKKGGGNGGNWYDYDDVVISRRGRRSYPSSFGFPSFGGSSGGGSSGGFGGFGGGGTFGGGGASGSW